MNTYRISYFAVLLCSFFFGCAASTPPNTSHPPTQPGSLHASAMSSSIFSIQWSAAEDDKTPQRNLKYQLYLSTDKANLLLDTNLVATINCSDKPRCSYDLDLGAMEAHPAEAKYHVALITLDGNGYASEPLTLTDLELLNEDLQLRAGVVLHSADEVGLPSPKVIREEAGERYIYTQVALQISVGDYIAQPIDDDGIEYYELLRVTGVSNDGFEAIPAPLIEISADPYISSGSVTYSGDEPERDNVEPGPTLHKTDDGT